MGTKGGGMTIALRAGGARGMLGVNHSCCFLGVIAITATQFRFLRLISMSQFAFFKTIPDGVA